MAFLTAMANSYGARWFDEKWQPQFDKPEWKKTLTTYVDLMKAAGPAPLNGFNETSLCSMPASARCDRRHGCGSFVTNLRTRGGRQGRLAMAPRRPGKNANWLWAWNLAIPAGSKKVPAAEKFIGWATSKDYAKLSPPRRAGRTFPRNAHLALSESEYLKVRRSPSRRLPRSIAADPNKPTVQPVPYVGVQYAAIPEFQASARRRPAILRGAVRRLDGRRGAGRRTILDRTRNEARRLHQMRQRRQEAGSVPRRTRSCPRRRTDEFSPGCEPASATMLV